MSQQATGMQDIFSVEGNAKLYEGVLSRRVFAFFIDITLISILAAIAFVFVLILGLPTFGLAWLLFPAVIPLVAIFYIAFTVGGEQSASPGMRALGLEARMVDGRKLYALIAVFHALLFYTSVTLLTPLILLVALISARGRPLHDIISGVVVVNKEGLS